MSEAAKRRYLLEKAREVLESHNDDALHLFLCHPRGVCTEGRFCLAEPLVERCTAYLSCGRAAADADDGSSVAP